MKQYNKEDLITDIAWLEGYGVDKGEATEFLINLANKETNLLLCASNGCVLEFGSEDLTNTTCNNCGQEAK